jgi:hypothetical protein
MGQPNVVKNEWLPAKRQCQAAGIVNILVARSSIISADKSKMVSCLLICLEHGCDVITRGMIAVAIRKPRSRAKQKKKNRFCCFGRS